MRISDWSSDVCSSDLSQQTGLPIIVHSRDAEADTLASLGEEMAEAPYPGVIHCFTASDDLARQALDLGLYISISGIVTFKNAADLRSAERRVGNECVSPGCSRWWPYH